MRKSRFQKHIAKLRRARRMKTTGFQRRKDAYLFRKQVFELYQFYRHQKLLEDRRQAQLIKESPPGFFIIAFFISLVRKTISLFTMRRDLRQRLAQIH